MGSDLYVSASGAMARLRDLDIVANNLANADTPGFKRDAAVFEAEMAAALQRPDGSTVPGAPATAFVDTPAVSTDHHAGPVARTGAPLDVAIAGPGFFEVDTPEGPRYTRAGSFAVNAARQLATSDGHPVAGEGGPIPIGSGRAEIGPGGDVTDADGQVLGRLRVVAFDEPGQLEKMGANLFRAPELAVPRVLEDAELVPGALERSNVVPVRELSALVALQRAFDINMQSIRTDDEITQQLLREFQ